MGVPAKSAFLFIPLKLPLNSQTKGNFKGNLKGKIYGTRKSTTGAPAKISLISPLKCTFFFPPKNGTSKVHLKVHLVFPPRMTLNFVIVLKLKLDNYLFCVGISIYTRIYLSIKT